MTQFTFEIDESLIDSIGISRMSSYGLNRWEVFLAHRIGSVKDDFGRPLGKYISGKGSHANFEAAMEEANLALAVNVKRALEEQNLKIPATPKGLSEENDLFKLLDL